MASILSRAFYCSFGPTYLESIDIVITIATIAITIFNFVIIIIIIVILLTYL